MFSVHLHDITKIQWQCMRKRHYYYYKNKIFQYHLEPKLMIQLKRFISKMPLSDFEGMSTQIDSILLHAVIGLFYRSLENTNVFLTCHVRCTSFFLFLSQPYSSKKKRFMLKLIPQRNASKFGIYAYISYITKKVFLTFFIFYL